MASGLAVRAYQRLPFAVRTRLRLTTTLQAARALSDVASLWRFRQLDAIDHESARHDGAVGLRMRALGGQPLWVRPGTSDLSVVKEALFEAHHLPPAELEPGEVRTILDLGANIGLTVADLAHRFPAARVLGVELDAGNAKLAERNVAAWHPRAEVLRAAAWTEDGEVRYGGTRGDEWGFRIEPAGGEGGGREPVGVAPALALAGLLERLAPGGGQVDYVKMDVEGAERALLAGGANWASRVRGLKVEVHPPYSREACRADLERLGFRARPAEGGSDWVVALRA